MLNEPDADNKTEEDKESAAQRMPAWRPQDADREFFRYETKRRIQHYSVPPQTIFRPAKPIPTIRDEGHKRVAVYARVSTKSKEQVSSIENQTKYYTDKIAKTDNWELTEIYSDEGKSGTSKKWRPEFKRMLEDAAKKKMDMIICASVSRFARNTVLSVADKVIEGVKSGAIKHFFLVGGCDGAKAGRNYYTEFVKKTPADTIILTLACGKFRFNDLDLGNIGGIPRILDMGQCNDAYSAIQVAVALSKAFGCTVNSLPLSMVLSWYEQKAVCILLTLLHLGIRNILLGPSLPAFISPNVLKVLIENYNIGLISTPEEDLKKILG